MAEAPRRLLVVWHSLGGTTATLAAALAEAAQAQEPDAVRVRRLAAREAGPADVLACDALVLATPETLGGISGLMKDFLDRSWYGLLGRRPGLPVGLLVVGGSDGQPTLARLRRVVAGQGWREVVPAVHVVTGWTPDRAGPPPPPPAVALAQARDTGAALAAGLALGVF